MTPCAAQSKRNKQSCGFKAHLSETVAMMLGRAGCQASWYTSPEWPYINTSCAGVEEGQ